MANQVTILSAGAVMPGLARIAEHFQRHRSGTMHVSFATAAAVVERLMRGEEADVVIAPPAALDELTAAGLAAAERVPMGRIGIGILTRDTAPPPQVETLAAFREALLQAQSIVYNRASTGTYLEGLFDRLGIGKEVAAKTTRYADFAAVLDHIRKGESREIGFGATTVIIENSGKGVRFVGSLPAEVQNYTAYLAALTPRGSRGEEAREFIRFLASPAAKAMFAEAGIS